MRISLGFALGGAVLAAATGAQGQPQLAAVDQTNLETVIVTGEKTARSLMNTGSSVEVLDADTIAQRGWDSTAELLDQSPTSRHRRPATLRQPCAASTAQAPRKAPMRSLPAFARASTIKSMGAP